MKKIEIWIIEYKDAGGLWWPDSELGLWPFNTKKNALLVLRCPSVQKLRKELKDAGLAKAFRVTKYERDED